MFRCNAPDVRVLSFVQTHSVTIVLPELGLIHILSKHTIDFYAIESRKPDPNVHVVTFFFPLDSFVIGLSVRYRQN